MPQSPLIRRSAVAVLAALSLTACGVFGNDKPRATATPTPTASVSASPSASVAPQVNWSGCSELGEAVTGPRTNGFDFTCTKLAVPVDYAKPDGPQTSIFVVRMHPRQQQASERIGSLVFNPGGPGVSGVTLGLSYVTILPDEILNRFDFVAFDPRGIGLSDPIRCATDRQKDQWTLQVADVRTPKGRAVQKQAVRTFTDSCVKKYGAALAQYNTETSARDLDRIRAAVQDEKLTYLGFSYGTMLGAQYAHLFPDRVRAAVLDGSFDPSATDIEKWSAIQLQGFESQYGRFAAWCARTAPCKTLGDVRSYTRALIRQADRTPLRSPDRTESRAATGGIVTAAALDAMYDKTFWPKLADALLAARNHGDPTGLFAMADEANDRDENGHFSNLQETFTAYMCNDLPLRETDAHIATVATDWTRRYPVFGPSFAAQLYSCTYWPATEPAVEKPTATSAPKIMVVGTTHDPATPYAGAASMVRTLGSAFALTWDGERHTAYPVTACVTRKVDDYLINLNVPSERSCPSS